MEDETTPEVLPMDDEVVVLPSPPTAPIIILCPICSDQLQIDAYMTTQILGYEGTEIIVSGSLHGTTKHACPRISAP